jgi:N-acetyl-gamma-glutamyl-phosphate reductase
MLKIAILGATGYTALELTKLLLRHPEANIVAVTSRQAGEAIASVHPQLADRLDLKLENLTTDQLAERAECIFSCLPHAASAEIVAPLLNAGRKVIDFSADYRLRDVATYEKWYGGTHPDPDRVGTTPYGLPEWFKKDIVDASLVANPGCYPTSAILALAPLLKEKLISADGIIIDSKSGVSGAGRSPKLGTLYPECNESISAYAVGQHRHTPEISQILGMIGDETPDVIFTPHLVPMNRGILSTAYSVPLGSPSEKDLFEAFHAAYDDCPFVRVVEHLPHTRDVVNTNYCDVTVRIVKNRIITISCEDNLIKGASGAAVQNFNLMFGFPETMALL